MSEETDLARWREHLTRFAAVAEAMAGLRHLPAAKAGVFMVFLPVSTALVGLLLGESLSTQQALAYGLALSGVLLATWPAKTTAR